MENQFYEFLVTHKCVEQWNQCCVNNGRSVVKTDIEVFCMLGKNLYQLK